MQEVSLLSAKAADADAWVKSDPWKGDCGPARPPSCGPPGLGGGGGGPGGNGSGGGGFGGGSRGRDGRQFFSHEVAFRQKLHDKHAEAWLEMTTNYLVDRCHGMEPLLEWVVQRQLRKIEPHDVAVADSGMHNSEALSKNLWVT